MSWDIGIWQDGDGLIGLRPLEALWWFFLSGFTGLMGWIEVYFGGIRSWG